MLYSAANTLYMQQWSIFSKDSSSNNNNKNSNGDVNGPEALARYGYNAWYSPFVRPSHKHTHTHIH